MYEKVNLQFESMGIEGNLEVVTFKHTYFKHREGWVVVHRAMWTSFEDRKRTKETECSIKYLTNDFKEITRKDFTFNK